MTEILRSNIFLLYICYLANAQAANVSGRFALTRMAPHREVALAEFARRSINCCITNTEENKSNLIILFAKEMAVINHLGIRDGEWSPLWILATAVINYIA